MTFFNKFSRLFGFGDNADEYSDEPDAAEEPAAEKTEEQTDAPAGLIDVPTLPVVDPQMKSLIFEGVVEIFNKSLPDFIARSIDPAAQRKQLCDALDKSVDDYLNSLMAVAEHYAENKLQAAMDASNREAEKLKADMTQLEQQRTALRESQLSADRRRRALSDRVNDLQEKLATAEAEREQYELENKSLLNKLKVADIQPEIVDELKSQIEKLKEETAGNGAPVVVSDLELEKKVALLEGEKAQLESEKATLEQAVADLRQQHELSQAMYNDLQEKFAEEKNNADDMQAKLEEAQKLIAEFEQLQSQLGEVENVIRKRDERIEKLKNSNKRLREDNESLRRRIEEGDAGLFSSVDASDTPSAVPVSEADKELFSGMSDLESDFECPDWFVADAGPGPVPLHADDSSFGYQEPPRKPRRPESDAQLSLF